MLKLVAIILTAIIHVEPKKWKGWHPNRLSSGITVNPYGGGNRKPTKQMDMYSSNVMEPQSDWFFDMGSDWEVSNRLTSYNPYYSWYKTTAMQMDLYGPSKHVGKINRGQFFMNTPADRSFGYQPDFNPQDLSSGVFKNKPMDYKDYIYNEIVFPLVSNSASGLMSTLSQNVIGTMLDSLSTHQIKLLLAAGFLEEPSILKQIGETTLFKVFASNLELISLISDQSLLQLAELYPDMLATVPVASFMYIGRTRPWIMGVMPNSVVTSVMSRLTESHIQELMSLMSGPDMENLLTFQPAPKVTDIPKNRLVNTPLQSYKSNLPTAVPLISELAMNSTLIGKISTSHLARLAVNKNLQNLMTQDAIRSLVSVHPSLVTMFNCSTLAQMSNNPRLVKNLPQTHFIFYEYSCNTDLNK